MCKHIDSVRENFFSNESNTTIVKRIVTKEQQDNKIINKIKSTILFKSLMQTEDKIKIVKTDRTKPKGPPPPPPLQQQQVINVKSNRNSQHFTTNVYDNIVDETNIPKSGFDFLDNW